MEGNKENDGEGKEPLQVAAIIAPHPPRWECWPVWLRHLNFQRKQESGFSQETGLDVILVCGPMTHTVTATIPHAGYHPKEMAVKINMPGRM